MAVLKVLSTLLLILQLFFSTTADDYRLPTIASPLHYEVHINITSNAFTNTSNDFIGTVVAYFSVSSNTTEINLHSSATFILITGITVNNNEISDTTYSVNSTTDILTINYESGFIVGTLYGIKIDYLSQLSVADMYGFYKSSYTDPTGTTKYLATTQFGPTYARRAFPCWDEPSFKATFTILFTYPSELNVLSNTPGTIRTINT